MPRGGANVAIGMKNGVTGKRIVFQTHAVDGRREIITQGGCRHKVRGGGRGAGVGGEKRKRRESSGERSDGDRTTRKGNSDRELNFESSSNAKERMVNSWPPNREVLGRVLAVK